MTPPVEDSHRGIQAEQSDGFRRDGRPHRADLLFRAAEASVVLVIFFWCLGLPLLAAFPLSLATWVAARRDLALMRKGLMDPRGGTATARARNMSEFALLSCCAAAAFVIWLSVLSSMPGLLLLLALYIVCLAGLFLTCWLFWLALTAILGR